MVAGAAAAAVVDGDAVGVTAAMKAGVATVLQAPGLSNLRESQRSAARAPLTQTRCLPIGNSAAILVPAANHPRGTGPATASPGQTGEAEARRRERLGRSAAFVDADDSSASSVEEEGEEAISCVPLAPPPPPRV